ncbi:MAG TPA: glycosyltransferase family 39 protein [Anaerolineae bacterium]|nr:glycosyltransferase family 39 protein [Anaerolineae bacterium]
MQGMQHRGASGAARSGLKLAVVALLAAGASLPFLSARPTASIDGPLHLYRLVELDHCLSLGQWFPRWTPDLVQGYGFPLFNFYPPLCYYLAELWHLLGASLARSLNLTFLLCAVLSGVFMYLLARDWAGEAGGVLAALLYIYAPYALYNAIYRGGLAEVLAWALAPAVLWGFHRLLLERRARWLAVASLSYAAFLLAHHLSALTFTPLLILLVAGHWLQQRSWRALGWALLALALAIGLSAFFTLPAFFEKGLVQIDRVFAPAGFDFHNHFVSWRALLAGPARTDVSLMNPESARPIGWIQIGLALIGALGLLAVRAKERAWYLAALAVGLVLFGMMQGFAAPVWQALVLLKYLQFPWRLLAPLSLVLAFAGGGVGLLLWRAKSAWLERGLVAAVALGLLFYSAPLLYCRQYRAPSANPSLGDLLEFERSSWLVSLTSNLDYLPIWVGELPASSPMAAQYAAAAPVTWLDGQALPPGVELQQATYGLNDMQFAFDSPVPFQALVNQYYFPGWRAYVDGAAAAVQPVAPHGLIGVDLPAGAHQLRLRFEDTPLRTAANLVSLCSLVALAGVAWAGRRRAAERGGAPVAGRALGVVGWALLALAVVCFIALKAAWLDRTDNWFKVTSLHDNRVAGMQTAVQANFGNEMLLLGCDLPAQPVAADEPLPIRLYWTALRKMGTEYSTSVQLVDGQGRLWGQQDSWHPGGYPTVRWEAEAYNLDTHDLVALPGTPPGEYWVRVAVYVPATLQGLDVLDGNGAPVGTSIVLGTVQVARPTAQPTPASLEMLTPLAAPLNDDLELLGCNLAQEALRPGQRLRLTLFWRATRRPQTDYQAVAILTAPDGHASRAAWPVAGEAHPTSAWQAGDIVRAQYDLLVAAETPPGANTLQVALAGPGGEMGRVVSLGALDVASIPHLMEAPPMQVAVGAGFGEAITLLGYDLDRHEAARGETIHLTLYWQARQGMQHEYTVFTHLLDAANHISAQQDSVPAQGSRPTTSWVKGEIIVDEYQLVVKADAPLGEHQIEIGVYEPASGRRLAVFDSSGQALGDRVLLCAVQVQ